MTNKWLTAMLGAAAITLSTGAVAQATAPVPNIYAGIEIGQADFGSDDDTALKIFGGYQFHRNIAAELGVSRLYDKGSTEITAVEVVGVGIFPIGPQFSILGKLGIANVDFDTRDDTELTFGIGAQYDVTRNLGVRVGWQRYDTDPEEVDLLSVGVLWRF